MLNEFANRKNFMDYLRTEPQPVKISFKKKNGDIRNMSATLNSKFMPVNENAQTESEPEMNEKSTVVVWDMEKEGFRSLIYDNLISANGFVGNGSKQ